MFTGELKLHLRNRSGQTIPAATYYQGALKVMRPQYLDQSGQATYFLLNPGGGYLDGDQYQMEFDLQPEARLLLTTQSATKIYRCPKQEVKQVSTFYLAKNSELISLPDAIIPYENSSYQQEQTIHMDASAGCFFSDIVTQGWNPEYKAFTYKKLNLFTKVYQAERLVFYDRLLLAPQKHELTKLGLLENYQKIGSLFAIHPSLTPEFITALSQQLNEIEADSQFGITRLQVPGFAMRILANKTQDIEKIIAVCYEAFSQHIHGCTPSFIRKY